MYVSLSFSIELKQEPKPKITPVNPTTSGFQNFPHDIIGENRRIRNDIIHVAKLSFYRFLAYNTLYIFDYIIVLNEDWTKDWY